MGIITLGVILAVSLIVVLKSADVFVDNLVEIGGALGISEIILGVTASAIGTSLPEFGSAVIASMSGSVEIGVGTVIGSNIWNIAGILGISATVSGLIRTNKEGLNRDWLMMLLTSLILIFFMLFGDINWQASVVMITAYCFYLWVLIRSQRKNNATEKYNLKIESEQINKNPAEHDSPKIINKKSIVLLVIGLVGLIVGCRLLVYSGVELATIIGIPEMIMGLFTLAIGTSIPELVVTLSSAMKGLHDLSIGTVLGSNTFNIIIGIGIPALLLGVPVERLSLVFDAPVMLFVTVLLMALIKMGKGKLKRWGGIILLITYVTYAVIRIFVLT
ncbi:calcium/sodium antiporter [Methanobacterium formicicum]|jgi:cation:H+ antiporter|uniref:Calcium/sodium antiporter n=1 Tax=Methanobacterium formicicum TaxID=2162 RepID=A0A843AJL1_METFO|nr:calcium/sodium antiporter [Methanobacterium formicicum]MBF4473996.1 calcium/sodium antiporter [Methanobacterium formicicum]